MLKFLGIKNLCNQRAQHYGFCASEAPAGAKLLLKASRTHAKCPLLTYLGLDRIENFSRNVTRAGLLFIISLVLILQFVSQLQAQDVRSGSPTTEVSAKPTKAELARERSVRIFRDWQHANPAYEQHQFDRIKRINRRTVRIFNWILGGTVVLVILNLVIIYLVLKGRGQRLGNRKLEGEHEKTNSRTEMTSRIGWLRRRYLAMFSNRSPARKTKILSKKFGFGIVGFVKKSGFYVLGLVLLATIFLALLKGFDIYVYNKYSIGKGAVLDNELDQATMRSFDYYPFSTIHIQRYARNKGWNGVHHITDKDEKYDFRSGDHGFFVDIDIDHPPAKGQNEYRIILTGGSGAQGFGGTTNDRMLYRRLEAELNKNMKAANAVTKVRVINLAMGGTVSYHNFIALNKWGHKLLPDMIISFSGHNEIAIPNTTLDDAGYSGAGQGALTMTPQFFRSPDWLKSLAKVFPGLVHRTSLGSMVRLFYYPNYSINWKANYWLGRYDPEYRGQYNEYDTNQRYQQLASKFDVRTEVINPWYIHAIESMRRDFPQISFVLALQPLHETSKIYNDLRNDMKAVFDGRTAEKTYWIDVHKHWEENEYFKGSLVDSVHLSDEGHILASKFLSGHLTPIILKNRSPKN